MTREEMARGSFCILLSNIYRVTVKLVLLETKHRISVYIYRTGYSCCYSKCYRMKKKSSKGDADRNWVEEKLKREGNGFM